MTVLEPGLFNPEVNALTMRPPRLHSLGTNGGKNDEGDTYFYGICSAQGPCTVS